MSLFGRSKRAVPPSRDVAAERPPGWLLDENRPQAIGMLQFVEASLPAAGCRVLMFVAPVPRVGTSTVAWAYARGAAELRRRRVLLLTRRPRPGGASATPRPAQPVTVHGLLAHAGGMGIEMFELPGDGITAVSTHLFWTDVRQRFDEIVVDCPAASETPLSLQIAIHADAVVVVLEADRTRAPVAKRLLADLQSVHANVVGAVLNKRHFHIPPTIYKQL